VEPGATYILLLLPVPRSIMMCLFLVLSATEGLNIDSDESLSRGARLGELRLQMRGQSDSRGRKAMAG
jgi:hypothetical protein